MTHRLRSALTALYDITGSRGTSGQTGRDFVQSTKTRNHLIISAADSPYAVTEDDDVLFVWADEDPVVINMPNASLNPHFSLRVIRMDDTDENAVTVNGYETQEVDIGQTTVEVGVGDRLDFDSDGGNFVVGMRYTFVPPEV